MTRFIRENWKYFPALLLPIFLSTASNAARIDVSQISCQAAQSIVVRGGAVVMNTGGITFRRFVAHRGFCERWEDVLPSYTAAADTPSCQVAFECYERRMFPAD